jgi:protein-S-isoprenylcysteine O-methyltransferase Ste14
MVFIGRSIGIINCYILVLTFCMGQNMTNPSERPYIGARKIVGALATFLLIPLVPLLAAGDWGWIRGWLYALITIGLSILSRVLIAVKNPDLIKERAGFTYAEGVKPWDRKLVPLVAIYLPLVALIVAGLDERFGWLPEVPLWLSGLALVVILLGYAVGTWAMLSNPFFSSVVRIQSERGHVTVEAGPYRYIRHPGYSSGIFTWLAIPLLLGSYWALIPAAIACALTILRTKLEDQTLIEELPGYKDYTQRTRYRLLPGAW